MAGGVENGGGSACSKERGREKGRGLQRDYFHASGV